MDRFQHTGQPDWDWWGKLWPSPGLTLRRLGVTSGDTLAEIACGNGYFTLPAARIADPARVYALDIDATLLDELSRLAEQQGIENVVTLHGDARELTRHLPEPVDILLLANAFHGLDDPAGFVREAFDSLRSDGRVVVVNWHDRPRDATTVAGEPRGPPSDLRVGPDETAAVALDAVDCTLEERVELPPYHYALAFER